jgi:hypothetical protein
MTVRELRQAAKGYGIRGRWKMRKAELAAAVERAVQNSAFLGCQAHLEDYLQGGVYAHD